MHLFQVSNVIQKSNTFSILDNEIKKGDYFMVIWYNYIFTYTYCEYILQTKTDKFNVCERGDGSRPRKTWKSDIAEWNTM